MIRTRVTGVLLASALPITVVATSCSAEADPETTPTTTMTTSAPSATPTLEPTSDPTKGPVEPTLPAAAKAPTRAGAEAFVRYYIDLLNYASQTGDVRTLSESASGCVGCQKYERLFAQTYENGGSFVGNLWRPFGFTVVEASGGGVFVLAQVRAEKGKYRARAGAHPQALKPDTYSLRFTLGRKGETWFVDALDGR